MATLDSKQRCAWSLLEAVGQVDEGLPSMHARLVVEGRLPKEQAKHGARERFALPGAN